MRKTVDNGYPKALTYGESLTHCGQDYYGMTHIIDSLAVIEQNDYLSDEEKLALQIAIQAVTDINDIMSGKRRGIVWG